MKQSPPPNSATNGLINFIGLLVFGVCVTLLRLFSFQNYVMGAVICLVTTTLAITSLEVCFLGTHRRGSTGLDWSKFTPSKNRVLLKFVGLLGTMAFIGGIYWLLPEYQNDFYGSSRLVLLTILPWWIAGAIPYFYFVDGKQIQPKDGYYQFGQMILGRFSELRRDDILKHLLGWLIKGFFLPLMLSYFVKDLERFTSYDLTHLSSFGSYFEFFYFLIFMIDLGFSSMGYIFSARLTDSHWRSTETTALGWIAALICYQPFWSMVSRQYFDYSSKKEWGVMLNGYPIIYMVWGGLILALLSIYVWATITFGARFSNLTNRGILTNGPYRWSRHPAYISKNLAWWLISVPFAYEGSVASVIRRCLMLAMVNGIYFIRARTEENHLKSDPDYIQYAHWIDKNGIFKKLRWTNFKG